MTRDASRRIRGRCYLTVGKDHGDHEPRSSPYKDASTEAQGGEVTSQSSHLKGCDFSVYTKHFQKDGGPSGRAGSQGGADAWAGTQGRRGGQSGP